MLNLTLKSDMVVSIVEFFVCRLRKLEESICFVDFCEKKKFFMQILNIKISYRDIAVKD